MKTNRAKNLAAAGTYLTTAVTHIDEAQACCHNRAGNPASSNYDVLFQELSQTLVALSRYLVNLQLALELNEAADPEPSIEPEPWDIRPEDWEKE